MLEAGSWLASYAVHTSASFGLIFLSVVTFVACQVVTAPYGRHSKKDQQAKWGPTIPGRLAWILMEAPSPIIVALYFFSSPYELNMTRIIFFVLFELHYINR